MAIFSQWAQKKKLAMLGTVHVLKGTGTSQKNWLKVMWSDKSRLGDAPPAIHYLFELSL